MAASDLGASVGGGETPDRLELGPTPSLRPTHASRELLTLTIDCLTELVQTVEGRHMKSIHQRLVDALKAADRVLPIILRYEDGDPLLREGEDAGEATSDPGRAVEEVEAPVA